MFILENIENKNNEKEIGFDEVINIYKQRFAGISYLLELNDHQKYEDCLNKMCMLAPELRLAALTSWVNNNIVPDPNDPLSLAIYSQMMGISIDSMKQMMLANEQNNNAVQSR